MDCFKARQDAARDPQAAQHVATCRMCNAVVAHPEVEQVLRAAAAAAAAPLHLPDPWPSMRTALAAERGPRARLRELPRGWAAAVALFVSLGVVVGVESISAGPHWQHWALWHQLATLIGGSGLLGVGLALALRSIFRTPPKAVLWLTGAVAIAAGLVMALTPDTPGTPASVEPFVWTRVFTQQCLACMRFGLLNTTPLLVWLGLSYRWQPVRPARHFAAGAVAALVGMLALEVHCPAVGLMHRLVGHASLGLLLGTLALVIGLVRAR